MRGIKVGWSRFFHVHHQALRHLEHGGQYLPQNSRWKHCTNHRHEQGAEKLRVIEVASGPCPGKRPSWLVQHVSFSPLSHD